MSLDICNIYERSATQLNARDVLRCVYYNPTYRTGTYLRYLALPERFQFGPWPQQNSLHESLALQASFIQFNTLIPPPIISFIYRLIFLSPCKSEDHDGYNILQCWRLCMGLWLHAQILTGFTYKRSSPIL